MRNIAQGTMNPSQIQHYHVLVTMLAKDPEAHQRHHRTPEAHPRGTRLARGKPEAHPRGKALALLGLSTHRLFHCAARGFASGSTTCDAPG